MKKTIKLTDEQAKELQPLFEETCKEDNYGKCLIIAQAYQTNGNDYMFDFMFLDENFTQKVRWVLEGLPK